MAEKAVGFKINTYDVAVQSNRIGHPVHVIRATNGNAVSNLD